MPRHPARPKARARTSRKSSPAIDPAALPHLSESVATARARQLVINATPAITRALLQPALEGHYLPARMLFDFAGLTAVQAPGATGQLAPVMKLLAEQLGLETGAAA